MKKVLRQGDVVIMLDQPMPEGLRKREDTILAEGEVTGHYHALPETAEVYGELDGVQWVVVEEPSELTHQEHDTLIIPPGVHEVRIQREYSPEKIRRVVD